MNIYSETPPTDLKELAAYQIAVQQAALEGKPLQWSPLSPNHCSPGWNARIMTGIPVKWNWENFSYRIDPASKPKVLRPWTMEECPLGAEVRCSSSRGVWSALITYKEGRRALCGTGHIPYSELLDLGYEWRLSSSVWQRCGVQTA